MLFKLLVLFVMPKVINAILVSLFVPVVIVEPALVEDRCLSILARRAGSRVGLRHLRQI